MTSIGDNSSNDDLKRLAENMQRLLDDKAEIDAGIRALKEAAKSDGYDMKAFNQVVRELRKGSDYQQGQLELELVLDTYRRGVGLPVTLDAVQAVSRQQAEAMPKPKPKRTGRAAGAEVRT